MFDFIKAQIPFELKRGTSIISIGLSLVVVGFFGEIGKWLFEKILAVSPFLVRIWKFLASIKFEFTLTEIIFYIFASLLLLFPVYRWIDRSMIKKIKGEVVFLDDFEGNKGWSLNYWGTTNPEKNNRIEQSAMIFEATSDEVRHIGREFGACIDLRNGIYSGYEYDICCEVKSEPETTMGFQLWVHDTIGRNSEVSKKEPETFFVPSIEYQKIHLKYVANSTNAIRIHLHNKAGNGKIYVGKISVIKL